MAQSSVDLIVNAVKAINPLRAVTKASKKAEQAIDSLKKAAKDTGDKLADMGRKGKKGLSDLAAKASQAAGRFGKLGKAAAAAAVLAGSAAFLKFSFGQAGELERQTKSLQVLTGSLQTAKGIIAELQAFGAVTPFTSTELIETAKRMKAFGFETNQVVDITKRLADVAGATGADLGGIATAFGQIQAKGRVQGEELVQLQERGVALQDELRKMYGLTGEEFSKALSKGQISAKAAEVALIRLTEAGGKYANGAIAQSDTLFGKLSTLQDALQRFGQNIGKVLSPIFKGIIDFLTTITNQINSLFREAEISNKVRQEFGLDTAAGRRKLRSGSVEERRALFAEMEARKQELRAAAAVEAPTIAETKIPALTAGTAGKESAEAEKTRKELEKQAEAAKRIAQQSKDRVRTLEEQTRLAAALTEEERIQVERNIEIENIKAQIGVKTQEQVDAELAATKALYEQQDVTRERLRQEKEMAELKKKAQEEEKRRAEELNSIYQGIGNTIADGVVTALQGAVNGTVSLAEAATNLLNNLANQMLQLATNMILFGNIMGTTGGGGGGGLFGFISTGIQAIVGGLSGGVGGGTTPPNTMPDSVGLIAAKGAALSRNGIVPFAKGGIVKKPTLFPFAKGTGLMGEAGPEGILPLRRGRGGRLGVEAYGGGGPTNIVVNVDASGSNVEADGQQQKALGKAIAAAIQSEIAKQKRPGGLLS